MNEDTFAGQWKQIKGSLRSWWGNLTEDDIENIGGEKDKLVGWIQENYGRSREQAAQEVDARLTEYAEKHSGSIAGLRATAFNVGETVRDKASGAANTVRSGVEKASAYFQERDFKNLGSDVAGLVRKYPICSVLISVGVGMWLARSGKR